MTEALREACAQALHVVTADGRTLRAGRAALFVLERTTPSWRLFARIFRFPPLSWGVEVGYFVVARNRPLFGRLLSLKKRPPSQ